MAVPLDELLKKMIEVEASDLHLKVGSPPVMRVDGDLHHTTLPVLQPSDTEGYAQSVFTQRAAVEFRNAGEADFAYGKAALGRFRVNAYRQRGSVGLVLRRVLPMSYTFDELGLPQTLKKLCSEPRGLVLVTGPTGSGKTTTLASMIDYMNSNRRLNIVTIEDPIEVLHRDKNSIVSQREIGMDTIDFNEALRRSLRQDPDVILIGEMRDQETMRAAMRAAETGHLVLSTMHTIDAPETVNRILDMFPPHQERQIRAMLASTLRSVISQRLLERVDGGRVVATEILINNGRVFDRIVNQDEKMDLIEVMAESEFYGMQTFDQAILRLFEAGTVSFQTALAAATSPHDLRVKAEQKGLLAV